MEPHKTPDYQSLDYQSPDHQSPNHQPPSSTSLRRYEREECQTVSDEHLELERFLNPRSTIQQIYDLLGAPLRMTLLPDSWSVQLGFTSLEEERMRAVLPQLNGLTLDIGAGTNRLMKLYRNGIGVDVIDWGGDALVVKDTRQLPFASDIFDCVSFVACLNHIPYREEVLREALRVLKPRGKIVVTMIGHLIGEVGHKIWWYSEDKHREVLDGELMGMDPSLVKESLQNSGYQQIEHTRFLYGLNHLFCGYKADV